MHRYLVVDFSLDTLEVKKILRQTKLSAPAQTDIHVMLPKMALQSTISYIKTSQPMLANSFHFIQDNTARNIVWSRPARIHSLCRLLISSPSRTVCTVMRPIGRLAFWRAVGSHATRTREEGYCTTSAVRATCHVLSSIDAINAMSMPVSNLATR
jgi:hypothetical protein